jgi:DNA polymerase-3 subunit epsilon/CBS domain-containing protein
MAKNPGCRHSSAIWRSVVESWFKRTGPSEALASDIFFDAVPVHGELMLANSLLDFSFERATSSSTFVSALARFASDWQPPIGMFGRLIVESDGRLDLKRNGIFPIVTAARTLALRHGIRPTPTIERLTELKSRSLADANVVDAAIAAFSMFLRTVLAQQIRDSRCGIKLSTRVQIASLGQTKKKGLIDSMQAVNNLIGATLSQ